MTRSKQSATDFNAGPEGTSKVSKERAIWTADDDEFLATFLLEHKAEAGDGANFKNPTFSALGKELDLVMYHYIWSRCLETAPTKDFHGTFQRAAAHLFGS